MVGLDSCLNFVVICLGLFVDLFALFGCLAEFVFTVGVRLEWFVCGVVGWFVGPRVGVFWCF